MIELKFRQITSGGSVLYIHGCYNVEWWSEDAAGPINDQGCDACESAPDGSWQPIYVRRQPAVER